MVLTRLIATLAMAATASGVATASIAAPLGLLVPPTVISAQAGLVQKIHGCHFDLGPGMAADPANGPHYHDNQCRVIRVGPQRNYQQRDYYDEPRRNRQAEGRPPYPGDPPPAFRPPPAGDGYGYGPPPEAPPEQVCYKRCRYRGPIKFCKTVCE